MHTSGPALAIILDTVVKSTVLLGFAWGAALALKKSSAATQHLVRTFSLAALLLLPFSVMSLPAWHVKGVPQFFKPTPIARHTAVRPATIPSSLPSVQEGPLAASSRHTAPAVSVPVHRQSMSEVRTASDYRDLSASSHSTSSATPQLSAVNPATTSSSDDTADSRVSLRRR